MNKEVKKKEEVKSVEDIEKLKAEEKEKWEIALELGYFDKIVDSGWKSLTARESGKVGGIMASRHRDKTESKKESIQKEKKKD